MEERWWKIVWETFRRPVLKFVYIIYYTCIQWLRPSLKSHINTKRPRNVTKYTYAAQEQPYIMKGIGIFGGDLVVICFRDTLLLWLDLCLTQTWSWSHKSAFVKLWKGNVLTFFFIYKYFKEQFLQNLSSSSWVLVAHVCNPSYSGGRDQKDCGSK
jgi:hypothetical protein